jgi:hypothetical protein
MNIEDLSIKNLFFFPNPFWFWHFIFLKKKCNKKIKIPITKGRWRIILSTFFVVVLEQIVSLVPRKKLSVSNATHPHL